MDARSLRGRNGVEFATTHEEIRCSISDIINGVIIRHYIPACAMAHGLFAYYKYIRVYYNSAYVSVCQGTDGLFGIPDDFAVYYDIQISA